MLVFWGMAVTETPVPAASQLVKNALVTTNGLNLTSIAMGKGATVLNGSGKQDKALSFTPDNYAAGSDLPIDPDKSPGGIAIGANAYARTGSVQIGSHTMKGYTMGGSEINDQSQANLVGMTTIGSNSYNKGALGSMLGAYSVMTGDFTAPAVSTAFATVRRLRCQRSRFLEQHSLCRLQRFQRYCEQHCRCSQHCLKMLTVPDLTVPAIKLRTLYNPLAVSIP